MAFPSVSPANLILDAATVSRSKQPKNAANQKLDLSTPADTVDIRGTSRNASLALAASDSIALNTTATSQQSTQTVTFTVTYPEGGSVTSTGSLVDFLAALSSDDPGSLGSDEVDGRTRNAKDAIRSALGLTVDNTDKLLTSCPGNKDFSVGQQRSGTLTSTAATGADVAIAILRKSNKDASTHDEAGGASTSNGTEGLPAASLTASSVVAGSFSGSNDGITVTLTVGVGTVGSTPAAVSSGISTKAVDVVV